MSSLDCIPPESRNGTTAEAPDSFKRKLFMKGRWLCPRRYIIALMLFLLLLLKFWSALNIDYMMIGVFKEDEDIVIGHWSVYELRNYYTASEIVYLLAQIPGALLIFTFTSHKYLLLSTVVTSVLHMLIPVVLRHHSVTLLMVLLSQATFEAPVYVAILSMWKYWAPPMERTKLIIFSVSGIYIAYAAGRVLSNVIDIIISRFYLLGTAGLVWALFWYNMISDTPQNDPLISESELLYLECSITPEDQQKRNLKDVPWKSIITSRPIAILCAIFVKMSISRSAVVIVSYIFSKDIEDTPLSFYLPVFLVFVCVIISSAILADFFIKRFNGRILLIRKYFLCGGFILQTCCLCGIFASSKLINTIFFVLAYIMYATSFPGFFTLALDLSPRYVAIISGILYTFFCVGNVSVDVSLKFFLPEYGDLTNGLLICDGILSLLCAGLFYKWGEVEEQIWSLAPTSPGTGPRCPGLYPKAEHKEDANLVPENV